MRIRTLCVCLLTLFAALRSGAQARKLEFATKLPIGATVAGTITLRVSQDPFIRPVWTQLWLKVDDAPGVRITATPFAYQWNTAALPDGKHVVILVVIDSRDRKTPIETQMDRLEVRTVNAPVALPPAAPPRPVVKAAPAAAPPAQPVVPALKPDLVIPSISNAPAARVERPLEQAATSLLVAAGAVAMGHADGSITVYDPIKKAGRRTTVEPGMGAVQGLARIGDRMWWVASRTSPMPQEAEGQAAPQAAGTVMFGFRESDSTLLRLDLSQHGAPDGPVTLNGWNGRIVWTDRSHALLVDPKTGSAEPLMSLLPSAEIAAEPAGSAYYFGSDGEKAMLARYVSGTDASLKFWSSAHTAWKLVGEYRAPGLRAPHKLLPGFAWCSESGSASLLKLADGGIERRKVVLGGQGHLDQTLDHPDSLSCSEASLWWTSRGRIYRVDFADGANHAWLPWNDRASTAKAIGSGGPTAWVATGKDVRYLDPTTPSVKDGYVGFVHVALGAETDRPASPIEQKLATTAEEWQGVPYKWGGAAKTGTDCSGFVMQAFAAVGVGLPHGSMNLRKTSTGTFVKSDLRFGDVLLFNNPGHAAIYIGDGRTAETVTGPLRGVGKSSIWGWQPDTVRRFLTTAHADYRKLASRGGNPKRVVKKNKR